MNNSNLEEGTIEKIMWATFRAISEHGYNETTISKIADEFTKSKSLLYYHYDSKMELLEDFLAFILEDRLTKEIDKIQDDKPYNHLMGVVDQLLPADLDKDYLDFIRVLGELRIEAPHHERFQKQFAQSDQKMVAELATAIERGVEAGAFRPVNAEFQANFLYSIMQGGVVRGVTLDDPEIMRSTREAITWYVGFKLKKHQ